MVFLAIGGVTQIYFTHKANTSNLSRYIPLRTLFKKLTTHQHKILLPVYCLTGCDTTSSFSGHGKKAAFYILINKAGSFHALTDLGSGPLTRAQELAAMEFTVHLYGCSNYTYLNDLRSKKAANNITAKKLPPTDGSIALHLLRCMCQLYICKITYFQC